MGDYFVSWVDKRQEGINQVYQIDYFQENKNNQLGKSFSLFPFIQLNEIMGNVAEPSTKPSTPARSMSKPPHVCKVRYLTPKAPTTRLAPPTVLGMSCNFRSRKTVTFFIFYS